jgi:EamA domain-containing membrane protein RarD
LNSTLIKAVVVVTFALIFYSTAVLTEQRERYISKRVLTFLTAGVLFDISSTILMIIGSRKIPITIHGFIGYSALTVMLIDTILIWGFWRKNGDSHVSRTLNLYTRFAYGWWVMAYIAGAIIAMTLKS